MRSCDDCKSSVRKYADGYVYLNWSGTYQGDTSKLPQVPDRFVFWTYLECLKNKKGFQFLNLDGKCPVFVVKEEK